MSSHVLVVHSFFLWTSSTHCVNIPKSIYLFTHDADLGCVQFGAIMNNVLVWTHLFVLGIVYLYMYVYFIKIGQAVFQSGCTILYYHQKFIKL